MSERPRLVALRVQGFKSFAERTVVEFAPGLNAVVGPNGSGKSNLADALRWVLGEQGRAIRSRKSEDVVFAGSERRAALGMADVTLVLDNADGLVQIDYATLELGRRLYRSGENDYLLNRQRVRLRDLVDLLDSAHLAENAFLFIGQGMVDQALALRPEERRPLFEEVAGVRRHDRRRRRAGEQLEEATANLARVEDVLAELRPQARRLAAQAEQQTSRARAGEELAAALVATVSRRWHVAAGTLRGAGEALASARRATATALEALRAAEQRSANAATELDARADAERDARGAHEAARAELAACELAAAKTAAEASALGRDRERLAGERAAAEADRAARQRDLALPLPPPGTSLDGPLADVDRELADARAEAGALRAAATAQTETAEAMRRARAARASEIDDLRRRLVELDRRRVADDAGAAASAARSAQLGVALDTARADLEAARQAQASAEAARDAARSTWVVADAAARGAAEEAAAAGSKAATIRGRLEALTARLAEEESRGVGRAARRLGGRALTEGLDVDPGLRAAVAAALGELGRSFVVRRMDVAGLSGERGWLILGDAEGPGAAAPTAMETARAGDDAARLGGGLLAAAVRADPTNAARRLLARCAWVPTVDDAVALSMMLPPGWRVVARTGGVVTAAGTVALGRADVTLDRRAELEAATRTLEAAEAESQAAAQALAAAEGAAALARAAHDAARRAESEAQARRGAAEDAERRLARDAEQASREAAWQASRAEAVKAERESLSGRLAAVEAAASEMAGDGAGDAHDARSTAVVPAAGERAAGDRSAGGVGGALAAWDARVAELATRRERLAAERANLEAERRAAEARRARAEASAALDEERIQRVDLETAALAERGRALAGSRDDLEPGLAAAREREAAARVALEAIRSADVADRDRLRAAEADVAVAREALRRGEDGLRGAEVRELEARLGIDAVREQALVELAALGDLATRTLLASAVPQDEDRPDGARQASAAGPLRPAADDGVGEEGMGDADDGGGGLAEALAAAGRRWSEQAPATEAPSAARLTSLRRRFHELGAANPFAVEEYGSLKARLDGLETQRTDLARAIERTRGLIAELDSMIASQFRATFAALETAFDRRFQQLFGGGFARLSLTEPADLAATGVEITARPPGKKAQALAMLSGGERALTAVALLFAMLEVRPVPFCVLDEVDAALDEANVGRFVDALRGLAQTTQFIVITHNRGTIEAADALFGVTVGDDAVSRVVSLRLEEAAAIAERSRTGRSGGRSASEPPAEGLAPAMPGSAP